MWRCQIALMRAALRAACHHPTHIATHNAKVLALHHAARRAIIRVPERTMHAYHHRHNAIRGDDCARRRRCGAPFSINVYHGL
jgi:hypothetical protein